VRVRDLLDVPGLGLRLLTDVAGMDRMIRRVYTTDLPDPSRYLTPGDLVLTGLIWCREPGDADRFVTALVKAGAAALGAGEAVGEVPPEVIQACGRHGITLLAVPAETSFAAVTEEVARRLAALRGTTAISVVTSDEVASRELLLASIPASVLRSYRQRMLGPLVSYDERHRAELLPTLREFLACSGSWNACAAKMYVHVNTVRYRIRRIEELTGRDLSMLDDQVDFFLALRIR
jgi:hypothetical protein